MDSDAKKAVDDGQDFREDLALILERQASIAAMRSQLDLARLRAKEGTEFLHQEREQSILAEAALKKAALEYETLGVSREVISGTIDAQTTAIARCHGNTSRLDTLVAVYTGMLGLTNDAEVAAKATMDLKKAEALRTTSEEIDRRTRTNEMMVRDSMDSIRDRAQEEIDQQTGLLTSTQKELEVQKTTLQTLEASYVATTQQRLDIENAIRTRWNELRQQSHESDQRLQGSSGKLQQYLGRALNSDIASTVAGEKAVTTPEKNLEVGLSTMLRREEVINNRMRDLNEADNTAEEAMKILDAENQRLETAQGTISGLMENYQKLDQRIDEIENTVAHQRNVVLGLEAQAQQYTSHITENQQLISDVDVEQADALQRIRQLKDLELERVSNQIEEACKLSNLRITGEFEILRESITAARDESNADLKTALATLDGERATFSGLRTDYRDTTAARVATQGKIAQARLTITTNGSAADLRLRVLAEGLKYTAASQIEYATATPDGAVEAPLENPALDDGPEITLTLESKPVGPCATDAEPLNACQKVNIEKILEEALHQGWTMQRDGIVRAVCEYTVKCEGAPEVRSIELADGYLLIDLLHTVSTDLKRVLESKGIDSTCVSFSILRNIDDINLKPAVAAFDHVYGDLVRTYNPSLDAFIRTFVSAEKTSIRDFIAIDTNTVRRLAVGRYVAQSVFKYVFSLVFDGEQFKRVFDHDSNEQPEQLDQEPRFQQTMDIANMCYLLEQAATAIKQYPETYRNDVESSLRAFYALTAG